MSEAAPSRPWPARALPAMTRPLTPLLRGCGVDIAQYRALLEVKLTLDFRRSSSTPHSRSGLNAGMWLTCVLCLFIGAAVGSVALFQPRPMIFMSMAMGVTMAFVTMILVMDFTDLLVDPAETQVLGCRPISGRTLLMVRLTHLLMYMGLLVSSLSLAPIVVGSFRFPVQVLAPMYLLCTVLTVLLSVFLVALIYLVTLRFFDLERFKDVVVYLQVGLSFFGILWGQVAGEFMEESGLFTSLERESVWQLLVPPCWFGALYTLALGQGSMFRVVQAVLALVVPLGLGALALRVSGSGYVRDLQDMAIERAARRGRWIGWRGWVDRMVIGTPLERAGFHLFWSHALRERLFRLRTFPMLGLPIVLALLFTAPGRSPLSPLLPVFSCLLVGPTFAFQMRYSESAEGAWAIGAAPLGREAGQVLAGSLKALCFGLLLPYMVVIGLLTWWQHGVDVLEGLPLAMLMVLASSLSACRWIARGMPFSEVYSTSEGAGRPVALMMGAMSVALMMSLLHRVLVADRILLATSGVVLAGLVILQAHRLRGLRLVFAPAES